MNVWFLTEETAEGDAEAMRNLFYMVSTVLVAFVLYLVIGIVFMRTYPTVEITDNLVLLFLFIGSVISFFVHRLIYWMTGPGRRRS